MHAPLSALCNTVLQCRTKLFAFFCYPLYIFTYVYLIKIYKFVLLLKLTTRSRVIRDFVYYSTTFMS